MMREFEVQVQRAIVGNAFGCKMCQRRSDEIFSYVIKNIELQKYYKRKNDDSYT